MKLLTKLLGELAGSEPTLVKAGAAAVIYSDVRRAF